MLDPQQGTQVLYIFYSYGSIFISFYIPASNNADLKKAQF